MKERTALLAILIWIVFNSVAQAEVSLDPNKATPLIGITAINNIDVDFEEPNAAAGGAMEMQRFFTTSLIDSINECGSKVEAIFSAWIKANKLIPSKEKVTQKSLSILVWSKDRKGLFEAKYLFCEKPPYVRTSLDYYDLSGRKLAMETINRLIDEYELTQLWNSLSEAIQCEE